MTYKPFPKEVKAYLKEINKGKTAREVTNLINEHFGTFYKESQIKSLRARMHLISGLSGHFEKGQVPHNKGIKGYYSPGSEKGWFKKGQRPANAVPVGSEILASNGYLKVKIAEPRTWRFKHYLVWEKHNGPVPKGYILTFLDGNKMNCSIENLQLITRVENRILNHQHLRSDNPELSKVAITLAKLKHKIKDKEKNKCQTKFKKD